MNGVLQSNLTISYSITVTNTTAAGEPIIVSSIKITVDLFMCFDYHTFTSNVHNHSATIYQRVLCLLNPYPLPPSFNSQ